MASSLRAQSERLYHVFCDLVRGYQFRDRGEICCFGLSVSQCYTLDALIQHGPMSMGELAGRLYLEISTMTRVVDQLVAEELAARVADAADRRVCRVQISAKGTALITQIRDELLKEYEAVLRNVPSESREAVIDAMSSLLTAFQERQVCRSNICGDGRKRAGKAG